MTTKELDAAAEKFIRSQGAEPAFKGYRGFPGSICASPNSMVVHGIPGPYECQRGDVLSIDVGVIKDGWVADAAMTVPIGPVDPRTRRKLLDVTRAALFAGAEQMRPGNHLGDVSAAIQRAVEVEGLSIIRTLVGHGIGREMHEDPQVPNFGEPGKGPVLEEGTVLAIEPMVNAGGPLVEMGDDGWAVYSKDGSLAAHFEFTVAVTADGPADPHALARDGLMLARDQCSGRRTRRPGPRSTSTSSRPARARRRGAASRRSRGARRRGCRRSRSRRRRASCSHLLARSIGARTVLEFGTLGGYSTIWLGRALPGDGRLITLEADPAYAEVARANIERAGLAESVELRVGPALETLPALEEEGAGPFDLVFIDADKVNTPDYFAWSLEHTRPGGLIVADNVVRGGALVDEADSRPGDPAQRRFHEMLAAEPRVEATTIQTVGGKGYDGFTIALVR